MADSGSIPQSPARSDLLSTKSRESPNTVGCGKKRKKRREEGREKKRERKRKGRREEGSKGRKGGRESCTLNYIWLKNTMWKTNTCAQSPVMDTTRKPHQHSCAIQGSLCTNTRIFTDPFVWRMTLGKILFSPTFIDALSLSLVHHSWFAFSNPNQSQVLRSSNISTSLELTLKAHSLMRNPKNGFHHPRAVTVLEKH